MILLSTVSPFGLVAILVIIVVAIVWPFRVANRIGKRKGRRGWLYPLVGLFTGFGTWVGVLVLYLLPARRGFSSEAPLRIRPSPEKAVFRDDRPKMPAYVPPKRCPECKGLVPQESPVCGHCGHGFGRTQTTWPARAPIDSP
ncbi:MAG TPA: hypothetical protein VHY55_04005 [Acidimicrobiia bacterium]|jgi:hypothetical protein|nr:hypothetical protein [Acidimicrobiia bacterium]